MRLGLYALIATWRARRQGNKRRYVGINWRAFWRGYNLFEPLMRGDLKDAPGLFRRDK